MTRQENQLVLPNFMLNFSFKGYIRANELLDTGITEQK